MLSKVHELIKQRKSLYNLAKGKPVLLQKLKLIKTEMEKDIENFVTYFINKYSKKLQNIENSLQNREDIEDIYYFILVLQFQKFNETKTIVSYTKDVEKTLTKYNYPTILFATYTDNLLQAKKIKEYLSKNIENYSTLQLPNISKQLMQYAQLVKQRKNFYKSIAKIEDKTIKLQMQAKYNVLLQYFKDINYIINPSKLSVLLQRLYNA